MLDTSASASLIDVSVLDGRELRNAFAATPAGLAVIAREGSDGVEGMIVSTLIPVSLSPALVGVCMQHSSATWQRLRNSTALGVSILGEAHGAAVRQLGSRDGDRFDGLGLTVAQSGAAFLNDSAQWFETRVSEIHPAGDHELVLLEIVALSTGEPTEPLVFHGSKVRRLRLSQDSVASVPLHLAGWL